MKGFYYIENTCDEWHTFVSGYFETLEAAKEALKECNDWWRPNGTGRIYYQEFGLNKRPEQVYQVR